MFQPMRDEYYLVGVEDEGGHPDEHLELGTVILLHLHLLLLGLALGVHPDGPEANLRITVLISAANRLIGEVAQSRRRPLLIQFHVERPWGQRPFSIVS